MAVDQNYNVLSEFEKIGTGMKVVQIENDRIISELSTVITGDINGDGEFSITDLICLKNHILNKTELKGCYFAAGNQNDDLCINIIDILLEKSTLLH